ncbi:hypothetical protein HHI36_002979 [Cryptolaemus montrouzieri]|uniref:Gustatory receptor n=1 Tax=Cryptolaemus montrouzieri TaxID=559131 RepID=A0ABD2PC76_9CUCU
MQLTKTNKNSSNFNEKMSNPSNLIYKSIKSVDIACNCFGLKPINLETNEEENANMKHSRQDFVYYLFYCSLFTILGAYTAGTLFSERDKERIESDAKNKFAILITVMILLMFFIISTNYSMRKKISSSVTWFGKIDTILLGFNMKINYDILRKDNKGLMILMFSSITLRSIIMIILIDLDFLQSVTMFLALTVKALTKYQFISYVNQLNIRFERVNNGLQEIFDKNTKDKIIFNHLNNRREISEEMLVMCRLHHKLCYLMRILNKAFGLQQLLSIAVSVCNILFQTYYLYCVLSGKHEKTFFTISCPLLWTFDEMMEIQLLVSACAVTCENANATAVILHEMRNDNYDVALEDRVQTYSLQMLHQKIEFSAMGYFVIDYTLSYSIIGAVTTYLVIFIQFDQSQSSGTTATNITNETTVFKINTSTTTTLAMN